MGKTAYGICMNCGCNKSTVEVYRCDSCKKMYCSNCAQEAATCPDLKCGTGHLELKGYIEPYDETEETLFI
jgi:hypothetical protein